MLFLGAMIGFFFFTTQYLQTVLHYPPSLTGMAWLSHASPAGGYWLAVAQRVTTALTAASVMLALALLLVARAGRTAPSACLSGTPR